MDVRGYLDFCGEKPIPTGEGVEVGWIAGEVGTRKRTEKSFAHAGNRTAMPMSFRPYGS